MQLIVSLERERLLITVRVQMAVKCCGIATMLPSTFTMLAQTSSLIHFCSSQVIFKPQRGLQSIIAGLLADWAVISDLLILSSEKMIRRKLTVNRFNALWIVAGAIPGNRHPLTG